MRQTPHASLVAESPVVETRNSKYETPRNWLTETESESKSYLKTFIELTQLKKSSTLNTMTHFDHFRGPSFSWAQWSCSKTVVGDQSQLFNVILRLFHFHFIYKNMNIWLSLLSMFMEFQSLNPHHRWTWPWFALEAALQVCIFESETLLPQQHFHF